MTSFKIGDRVLFTNENETGIITMLIGDSKIKVLNKSGFEELVTIKEIIHFPNDTHKEESYSSMSKLIQENNNLPIPADKKFVQFSKDKTSHLEFKADLHVENLIEHYNHLESFEILQIQRNRCKVCIQNARKHGFPRLKLVHGIGDGVLRNEIHSLLKDYGLKFVDEYGFTEVIIS